VKVVENDLVAVVVEFASATVDCSFEVVMMKDGVSLGDAARTTLVESPAIKVDGEGFMTSVDTICDTAVVWWVNTLSIAVVMKGSMLVDAISSPSLVAVCCVLVDVGSMLVVHNAPIKVDGEGFITSVDKRTRTVLVSSVDAITIALVMKVSIEVDRRGSIASVDTSSCDVVASSVDTLSIALVMTGSRWSVDLISSGTLVDVCSVLVDIDSMLVVGGGSLTVVHNAPTTVDVGEAVVATVDNSFVVADSMGGKVNVNT
jgi:hypothetical protein